LAIGGDLSADRLIEAYTSGIFPWFNDNEPILWWSPDPRAVLFPEDLRINRSLKRALKKHDFTFSHNQNFTEVIKNCAAPRATDPGTWITQNMLSAYTNLHRLGIAHSFECWQGKKLAGGMYGVWIGNMFFAESMFKQANNASKITLIYALDFLSKSGVKLIDIQIISDHLLSMGAREIPRAQYLEILKSL